MWFAHTFRVRYAETDQMGVVYHTNYLNWFEWARTELIRHCGFPYRLVEERGLLLPVLEAEAKFRQPARYDEIVTVFTRITAYTNVRLEFAYEARRRNGHPEPNTETTAEEPTGELLVTGSTKHMWVNRAWKPARLDRELPELYALLPNIACASS